MNEREDRPTASPVYTLPSEDDVAQAIYAVDYPGKSDPWDTESRADKNEYRAYARAVLALIPPQQCAPSVVEVAQVKTEALREAAEYIVLREDHVGCPSCRVNAEAEAEVWLRDRAAAIENGAGRG